MTRGTKSPDTGRTGFRPLLTWPLEPSLSITQTPLPSSPRRPSLPAARLALSLALPLHPPLARAKRKANSVRAMKTQRVGAGFATSRSACRSSLHRPSRPAKPTKIAGERANDLLMPCAQLPQLVSPPLHPLAPLEPTRQAKRHPRYPPSRDGL